jgi:toxin ParE1/3/4
MSKPLRLDDEAREELEVAAQWYEARRTDLGIDFLAAVRGALALVGERPRSWPLVRGVATALDVRAALLRRFPYRVVFVELPAEIRVLAIAHTSREPGFWRRRL